MQRGLRSQQLGVALTLCLFFGGQVYLPASEKPLDGAECGVTLSISDEAPSPAFDLDEVGLEVEPISLVQPQPALLPSADPLGTTPVPSLLADFDARLFAPPTTSRRVLPVSRQTRAVGPSTDVLFRSDSKFRVGTDAGSLFGKAPSILGVEAQRRTPIVNDPRVRGGRVGRLAAAGSYWVPARLDLDTMLSKIDSRIVSDMIVIKGPYSVLYGPGFEFVDLQLMKSPRYQNGFETHGSTSSDYKTNGEQIYGRQEVWGGNDEWGFRVGYGHRTGNDYQSGDGSRVPSSYNSRDFDLALGRDLSDDSYLEFSYLRLDQTNVELPGQAFDIDFLVTDGLALEYGQVDQPYYDRLVIDTWYNQTRFDGSAQRPGKRRQFPAYDFLSFEGMTHVESLSTGFRAAMTWGDAGSEQLTAGTDFRYIKQQLDEVTSGRLLPTIWMDRNSPIPRSYSGNPGLFAEYFRPLTDQTTIKAGVRGDSVSTNVIDDQANLNDVGIDPNSYANIVGTSEFDQSFTLLSGFLTAEHEINSCWTANAGVGYAERPPDLTELYAAQPFMFLLQNGLNTVTGDPQLAPERRWQVDLGLAYRDDRWQFGARGFYALVRDYITFEATRVILNPVLEQVSLQFVNTDRASLAGGEAYAELAVNDWLTPFATAQYVEGRDLTRNGDFATIRAAGGMPKVRVPGQARGEFSGLTGAAEEPLPGISPFEGRLGIRLHEPCDQPNWLIEISARVVDNQDRVASSLLELPTPGFTVGDIRGYWRPCEDVLLIAGVENFTDRNYREHLDFNSLSGVQLFQPGVNFYFGGELTY